MTGRGRRAGAPVRYSGRASFHYFITFAPGGYMRILSILLSLLFVCCSISGATAGSIAERVKARGFVRCGSAERP